MSIRRLMFTASFLLMLGLLSCSDSSEDASAAPSPPAGMFSTLPTTEPPIAGDAPVIVISLEGTPEPMATSSPSPTPTSSPESTHTPTPEPTQTPSPQPTQTPTPEPTPTSEPTATCEPTQTPLPKPTQVPTPEPTQTSESKSVPEPTSTSLPMVAPDATTAQESTPIPSNSSNQSTPVSISGSAATDAFCAAITSRKVDLLKIMVKSGVDLNAKCGRDNPALYWAIILADGNAEMVRLLVSAGADVNVTDRKGRSMLYWATIKDNPEIVQILTNLAVAFFTPTVTPTVTP